MIAGGVLFGLSNKQAAELFEKLDVDGTGDISEWEFQKAAYQIVNGKVVLAAVTENGCALEDAAKELQADREVVLAAVAQNGYALYYAWNVLRAYHGTKSRTKQQ